MKRLMVISAAACALAIGLPGTVLAAGSVPASTGDPYSNCSNAHQTGTNYPSAEVEPWVTAIPKTSNLVAVWQQDRWSNGGRSRSGCGPVRGWRRHLEPDRPALQRLRPGFGD